MVVARSLLRGFERKRLLQHLTSEFPVEHQVPGHGHIIVVPMSDSLVALGINGHFYLGCIEEEVLGRALHGARVLLLFLRCSWLCKMPQRASNFYSLAPAKLSIETVFFSTA